MKLSDVGNGCSFMLRIARRHAKTLLVFVCLFGFLSAAAGLAGTFLPAAVVAGIENGNSLTGVLTVAVSLSLLLALLLAARKYIETTLPFRKTDIRYLVVERIISKGSTTSYPNLENKDFIELGNSARRAVANSRRSAETVWDTFSSLLQNIIELIVCVALLSCAEIRLLAVSLLLSLAGWLAMNRANGWERRHREEEARWERSVSYALSITERRDASKEIYLFGLKDWVEDVVQSSLRLIQSFTRKRELCGLAGDFVTSLLVLLRNGIAYAVLVGMVLNNRISVAEFLLYFSAVGSFTAAVTRLLGDLGQLRLQDVELGKITDYLDFPEPFLLEGGRSFSPPDGRISEIVFDNVTFKYPGSERNIIERLSCTFSAGRKVALVGLNGAGKTTLVKLLAGMYDPTEGRILVDGVDIRELNRADYYRQISAVFQSSLLLDAEIKENITGGMNSETSDADVEAYLRRVGIWERVSSLPEGMHTHIGKSVFRDGIELSGGEMQRLFLARALFKNAPVLLLDEPTANLDPIAEEKIYRLYAELGRNLISCFVSHRLTSTSFCDEILYLEDGKIRERGSHDELLKRGGKYAELYRIQSRYYRED